MRRLLTAGGRWPSTQERAKWFEQRSGSGRLRDADATGGWWSRNSWSALRGIESGEARRRYILKVAEIMPDFQPAVEVEEADARATQEAPTRVAEERVERPNRQVHALQFGVSGNHCLPVLPRRGLHGGRHRRFPLP